MKQKFQITKSKTGRLLFNLKAKNGQTILTSQMYKSRSGLVNGIQSVQKNSRSEARFERKKSSTGKPYFRLKSLNGQVIGKSELYNTEKTMESGIKSVKRNGQTKRVVDATKKHAVHH